MGILSDIQAAFDAVSNEREYTGGDSAVRYIGGVAGSLYKNLVKEPVRSFGLLADSVDKARAGQPINLVEDIQMPMLDWGMVASPVGMMTMPSNSLGIFAGKMAKTADRAALSKAEKLAAQGVDMPTIWKETGWGMAPDGAWRFEIPDDALRVAAPDWMKPYGGPAGEYFSHPELYAAYPDIAQTRVGLMDGAGGLWDSDLRKIGIGRDGNVTSTGAHELQHAVQSMEEFARGGSPDEFGGFDARTINDARIIQARISRGEKPSEAASWMRENLGRTPDIYAMDLATSRKAYTAQTPFEQYRSLHGEAEARAVQDRLHMTPEERRNVFPEFMGRDDLIVRRGGGGLMENAEGWLPLDSPERAANFERWSGGIPLSEVTPVEALSGASGSVVVRATHGSRSVFDAFDMSKLGDRTGAPAASLGAYFSGDEVASMFGNANVGAGNRDVFVRMKNPYELDAEDLVRKMNDDGVLIHEELESLAGTIKDGMEDYLPDVLGSKYERILDVGYDEDGFFVRYETPRGAERIVPQSIIDEFPDIEAISKFEKYSSMRDSEWLTGGDPLYFENLRASLIADGFDGIIVPSKNGDFVDLYPEFSQPNIIAFSPKQIKSATHNAGTYNPNDANILKGMLGSPYFAPALYGEGNEPKK